MFSYVTVSQMFQKHCTTPSGHPAGTGAMRIMTPSYGVHHLMKSQSERSEVFAYADDQEDQEVEIETDLVGLAEKVP